MLSSRSREFVAVFVTGVMVVGACSGDDGGTASDEASGPPLELVDDAVVRADDTVLPASETAGRDAPSAWRTADLEVETKGGGGYVGHELLNSPDDDEVPGTMPTWLSVPSRSTLVRCGSRPRHPRVPARCR